MNINLVFLSAATCVYDPSLLSIRLLPYVLPFVVEFVLIGAATLYKIMEQIGMPVTKEMLTVKYIPMLDKIKLMHGRVFLPSIFGWVILLATAAGTIFFIYVGEDTEATEEMQRVAAYVFYLMQIILNVIGIIAITSALLYESTIPFLGHAHSVIDQAVLIVTLFGFYLLIGFNFLPNLESFMTTDSLGTIAKLGTFENICNYIQASMQFLFIMDAMRRGSQPLWQKYTKAPAFVLILFYTNVALWLVTSFLVKETSQNPLMIDYYGDLTWNIVLYTTLPLAIFFRFHSTICLVDIMVDIWMPEKIGKD